MSTQQGAPHAFAPLVYPERSEGRNDVATPASRAQCGPLSICYARLRVLILFYILAIQQLLQGIYSALQGVVWLRFVRRRLATHAGFYSPRVAVICPCKGVDPGLESNLQALTHFDYPNYEIIFVVAKATDTSVKIIERIKSPASAKFIW